VPASRLESSVKARRFVYWVENILEFSEAELIVQAEVDHLETAIGASRGDAGRSNEKTRTVQSDLIVFQSRCKVVHEGPFGTRTDVPAIVAVVRGGSNIDAAEGDVAVAVSVADPCSTALCIEEPVVERVAQTCVK